VSRRRHRAGVVALTAALLSCEGAFLTAPPDSTIGVTVNPSFVAAHGGVSEVTAFVIEPAGTYVPDGTVVRWTTDLGSIDPETRTRRGVANARFVSDSRSGLAHIRAFSGSVSADAAEITVGNARVVAIRLRAVPSRITISNSTHVIATVVDTNGNPVANVPVFFEVVDSLATEFFDSAGAPVHTNNNGEAEDVLRTRRTTAGVAEVQARAPDGAGGFVTSPDPLRIPIL
jgi:Big-like domain-containing protein